MMPSEAWDRGRLAGMGFEGFVPLSRAGRQAPASSGVYVVLRETSIPPKFTSESKGGWFKGRNPAVPLAQLEAKWIDGAEVAYIGQGGNLRRRLSQLSRFGEGVPVGHWGGRYLWQLSDCADFAVAWRREDDPREGEATLLRQFRREHGALPFANLR